MSKFWTEAGEQPVEKPFIPTVMLLTEDNEDGSRSIVPRVLEHEQSPLSTMTWDDFSLSNCLKHGVSYKALSIPADMRMGHEDEISAYEERLSLVNDSLFVQPKN